MNKIKILLLTFLAILLHACSSAPRGYDSALSAKSTQARLGTKWGDEVEVNFQQVHLQRKSNQAIDEKILHYAASRQTGSKVRKISLAAGKIDFSVQDETGKGLALMRKQEQYYLQGKAGQAYQLVYENHSDQPYEVVASVDGLNVLTGKAASRQGQGYVIPARDKLVIKGFRKGEDAVASFIFSSPDQSYAAQSAQGNISNTGIIGMVIYELYDPNAPKTSAPSAFPADDYAKAPR